jgi:large subunit ribosomal protein L13
MNKKPVNTHITERTPVVISARGKILGRLATEVATILRGKDSVHFESHLLSGRPVVVTHAKDIVVTGNKMDKKMYYRHSGYLGSLKEETLRNLLNRRPDEVIRQAVRGMLPSNRLRKHWLASLDIREEE